MLHMRVRSQLLVRVRLDLEILMSEGGTIVLGEVPGFLTLVTGLDVVVERAGGGSKGLTCGSGSEGGVRGYGGNYKDAELKWLNARLSRMDQMVNGLTGAGTYA